MKLMRVFVWPKLKRGIKPMAEFATECLLFTSKDKMDWLFGVLAWGSFFLLGYAVYNIAATY